MNLSSIVRFSKLLRQAVPYKAENDMLYYMNNTFRNPCFLDICQYALSWSNLFMLEYKQNIVGI